MVRRLVAHRWDIVIAVMAAAPFVVGAGQSYGGEAMLRAYLISLPWLSFLASAAPLPVAGAGAWSFRRALRRRGLLGGVTAALGSLFMLAYFGQESVNYMPADDVAVNHWYGEHAPSGAVSLVATNSPSRLDWRYPDMSVGDAATTLTGDRAPLGHQVVPEDMAVVEHLLTAPRGTARYLVITQADAVYLRYYRLVPDGWMNRLVAAVHSSPDFRLVFSSGASTVFQLIATKA
jgi:hypothetical protein